MKRKVSVIAAVLLRCFAEKMQKLHITINIHRCHVLKELKIHGMQWISQVQIHQVD